MNETIPKITTAMSGVLLAGLAFGGIVRRFDVSLDDGLHKKNATDARLESAAVRPTKHRFQ